MGQPQRTAPGEFVTASGIPVAPVYTPEHLTGVATGLPEGEPPQSPSVTIPAWEIREAGANAIEELAFAVKQAIEHMERTAAGGAPRLCFRFSVQSDFFEEVAKLRAARRLWAQVAGERFGLTGERGGVRIEARVSRRLFAPGEPYENVVRTALAVLAALAGGADEVDASPLAAGGGLPEDSGAVLAERVTQAILHETGITRLRDPFGGSYFVESLTGELERRAAERIMPAGGQPTRQG